MATDGAASRSSSLELEGPIFDGRFRVEQRIAEGGFAVVYRAWQLALERRVALKVLKPPNHRDGLGRAEFRERFAAEARTIARLRHPDIVDVYDFSVATLSSGELAPWMALEWLDGETLAQQLARRRGEGHRGRDPREAVELLRPVMRALAHAHGHGIVHRDIKPSNIMVSDIQGARSLRVLDFGIAKIMVDHQPPNTGNTRTESAPAFSPAYAAPEQVAFSRTGPWTDVHALGLVLTELMTDAPAFSEADPEAHFFEQVMAGQRPTPASKGRDVGPYEPILARALALAPRDRWRSVGELMAALDEAGSGFPPQTPGDAVAGIQVRRGWRTVFAAPLAALVLLVVGVAAWSAGRRPAPPPRTPPRATASLTPDGPTLVTRVLSASPAPTDVAAGLPAVATTTRATRAVPRKSPRKRRPPAASPARSNADGRDLFDDTR